MTGSAGWNNAAVLLRRVSALMSCSLTCGGFGSLQAIIGFREANVVLLTFWLCTGRAFFQNLCATLTGPRC